MKVHFGGLRIPKRWWMLIPALPVLLFCGCIALLVVFKFVDPPTTAVQVERRIENLFSDSYEKKYRFVPLSGISRDMQHAVIAAEDGGFYRHQGIDWEELEKVLDETLAKGELGRGGSTITQQLVKNLFLTTHFGLLRKGAEFVLAPVAEWILGKERILELYLNVVEWGDGIYGVESAARTYFGVSAEHLNRDQAARLAACLPAPLSRRPDRVDWYAEIILERMRSRDW